MPTDRLNLCVVLVALGWVAAAPARAGDGLPARPAPPDPEANSQKSAIMITDAGEVAAQNASCEVIGGFDDLHAGQNRYRGNAFRMEYDAVLVEIRMELRFDGEVDLYFSVHRAPSDEGVPYERALADCVALDASDDERYESCTLPTTFLLEAESDYLIGVAWGQTNNPASRNVTYGRDQQTYPLPFLQGQVLGLVAVNTAPPIDDTLELAVFNGGAYSMELCFEPVPGACCVPPDPDVGYPGGCDPERLPADCVDPGGWFHGQRTVCDPNLCDFGACCEPCEECLDDYAREACEAEGWTWAGANVPCPASPGDLCPEITGACCNGANCSEVCDDDCDALGGDYLGDGTTCEPNFCAGACCVYGTGCGDTTREICGSASGDFKGEGTTCDALPPELECGGACCALLFLDPICLRDLRRDQCVEGGDVDDPVYMGDATQCWDEDIDDCTAPSTRGACCLPDGSCLITSQDFCQGSGDGAFVQDGTCDQVTCTACCTDTGECYMSATGQCPAPDTVIDPPCVPNRCIIPIGACCFNDENTDCVDGERRDTCEQAGGRFQEGNTDCENDCPDSFGACCRPNGTCTDRVTESECEDTLNGKYYDGTACDSAGVDCPAPDACCPALGACCLDDGTCFVKLSDECEGPAGLGGSFAGAGVECGRDTCPTGACCVGSDCIVPELTRAACDARLGGYRGDGTVCSDDTIKCGDIEGACCMPDEDCESLVHQDCFDHPDGGEYQGEGVPCGGDVCTLGACCPPDFPDGDCVDDVLPLECDADGGESYPGVACLERPCDPTGACCNGGDCTIEKEVDCIIAGGLYQGDDTECLPGLCTLGACCHLDGTCEDGVLASACTDPADFYPNRDCSQECYPRGACCKELECLEGQTRQLCENAGGTYDGDGTVCREELCVAVACCMPPDDECVDGALTRQECEMNDGVYLPGATCVGADCTRGACCRADGTCALDNTIRVWCEDPEDFQPGATCNDCVGRGVCCVPDDETCYIMTQEVCQQQHGGRYGGDATVCEPTDLCRVGACCMFDENCDDTQTRLDCELAGGIYVEPGATCDTIECARGACCEPDGTCRDDTVAPKCTTPGSDFHSSWTCETLDPPCEPKGACCDWTTYICEDFVTFGECQGPDREWTQNVPCADLDPPCEPTGACCIDATCLVMTESECADAGGSYQGDDTPCEPNPCQPLSIVSSSPPDCTIDARQPSKPDGSQQAGWDSIVITFDGDASGLTDEDFTLEIPVGSMPGPPAGVIPSGSDVTVLFPQIIPTAAWSCVVYNVDGTKICLGYLPADVSGDRTSAPADILYLIDCLNGVRSCEIRQCDVDRSDLCGPPDILRVIDLLNGAGDYEAWLNRSIADCPSAP